VIKYTQWNVPTREFCNTLLCCRPVDWSEYGGVWIPCAGSVTPWKSHLGSEEYEPDARVLADFVKKNATGNSWTGQRFASWPNMYLGLPETTTNEEVAKKWFPYNYGYPWEVRQSIPGFNTCKALPSCWIQQPESTHCTNFVADAVVQVLLPPSTTIHICNICNICNVGVGFLGKRCSFTRYLLCHGMKSKHTGGFQMSPGVTVLQLHH
jgi:hypothetical protein